MSAALHGTISVHAKQLAFLISKSPITVAVAGIRGGKTHVGALKTILYAMENATAIDEFHLVCSPTYPMSRVPIEKIFSILYDKEIFAICPLIKFIKSERVFLLAAVGGGITRIKVCSLHDPDKIRGIKARSAWLDEGAYMTQDAWNIVQGRLADCDGPCWITTTPAGYNFIHELYEKATEQRLAGIPIAERGIRFIHWRSTENTFISQKGFARIASQYDSRTYAQEVEALFVKVAGLVYYPFDAGNVASYHLRREAPVWIGQDFNVSAMASSFSQPINTPDLQRGLHVFEERIAKDSDTFALVNFYDRWCSDNSIEKSRIIVFPDASGSARNTTGKSDHEIIKRAGYKIQAARRNPFVKDRINCMNGLIKPANSKHRRLLVDPSCIEHLKSFRKQIYIEDSDPPTPDKSSGLDHIMDACGYTAWGKFPLRMTASLGHGVSRKAA